MKNINKKGFTLVELLAVIVVLAIVMSLAVVSITNVLDSTRRNSFIADAKSFLDGAHQLVDSDFISGYFGDSKKFAPKCETSKSNITYIPLSAINLERGGVTSPYGNPYDKGSGTAGVATKPSSGSYIMVTSSKAAAGNCTYTYSIYLTDGVFSIGTTASPVAESGLKDTAVK